MLIKQKVKYIQSLGQKKFRERKAYSLQKDQS